MPFLSKIVARTGLVLLASGLFHPAAGADSPQCTSPDTLSCRIEDDVSLLQHSHQTHQGTIESVIVHAHTQQKAGPAPPVFRPTVPPPAICSSNCTDAVKFYYGRWPSVCQQPQCSACSACKIVTDLTKHPTMYTVPKPPSNVRWPSEVFQCPVQPATTTNASAMTKDDYDAIVASVIGRYNSLSTDCADYSGCPQQEFAGCVLRLAGHDMMDFRPDGTGGPDGCVDMQDSINTGLDKCLVHVNGTSVVESFREFCGHISLADFIVIAAEAMLHVGRGHVLAANPKQPDVNFLRANFKFGRTTAKDCKFSVGRMPDPEGTCIGVEQVFNGSGMGLNNWTEAAALMAVHGMGKASVNNSGYDGYWNDLHRAHFFDNTYFASLFSKGWRQELEVKGNKKKNQWIRSDAGRGRDWFLGKQMMLNTDLCMVYSEDVYGEKPLMPSAGCSCAWTVSTTAQPIYSAHFGGRHCGSSIVDPSDLNRQRTTCCHGNTDGEQDCGTPLAQTGSAAKEVYAFALDEPTWLKAFESAWSRTTTNGMPGWAPPPPSNATKNTTKNATR